MCTKRTERGVRLIGRNDRHQLALVRDMQRIEPQNFARPAHGSAHRHALLIDGDRHPRTMRDLVQCRGHTAARRILDRARIGRGAQQRRDDLVQRRAIALDAGLEFQRFTRQHHRHPMIADVAADEHDVARRDALHGEAHIGADHADSAGVDEQLIRLATVNHFCVARDDRHSRLCCGHRHRLHDTAQNRHVQSLLEDQSD